MRQSLAGPRSTSGVFVTVVSRLWTRWVTWWEFRATVRTLRGLDARSLRDIGIDRYDIEQVARSQCWPYDR